MSVFDGLPDIFADTLGEPVIYTPISTGLPRTIQAIWTERSADVVVGEGVPADSAMTTLSVRAADVIPREGDRATRVADGKIMEVTTPILPDGKGMIRCNLAVVDDDVVPEGLGFIFSNPANSGYLALLEEMDGVPIENAWSLNFGAANNSGYLSLTEDA